jgi:hypothetical protein
VSSAEGDQLSGCAGGGQVPRLVMASVAWQQALEVRVQIES